jgi:hypothetical protein
MARSLGDFTRTVRASTTPVRSAFSGIGSLAAQLRRQISALNTVSLSGLSSRLNALRSQLQQTSHAISRAGSGSIGVAAGSVAAGYAINKALNPQREKENVQGQLGMAFTEGGKYTLQGKMDVGQLRYEQAAKMAAVMPGSVSDVGNMVALLRRTKVIDDKTSFDDIKKAMFAVTDGLAAMGKSTLDEEVIRAYQAASIGNISDLIEKTSLRHIRDNGLDGFKDLQTGQKTYFNSQKDLVSFVLAHNVKKYGGSTDVAMKSTAGIESSLGDAVTHTAVKTGEMSGLVDLYKQKVKELTASLEELSGSFAKYLKPIADFGNNNPNVFKWALILIPSLVSLGVALKALSFALSGFALIFSPIGIGMAAVAGIAYVFYTNLDYIKQKTGYVIAGLAQLGAGLTIMGIAGMTAVSPLLLILTGVTALAAAAYLIYDNWDGISGYFKDRLSSIGGWFSDLVGSVTGYWHGLVDVIESAMDLSGVVDPIKSAFYDGIRWVSEKWDGLVKAITSPVDFKGVFDAINPFSGGDGIGKATKTGRQYNGSYASALADRESSGNPFSTNKYGYTGLFQMGKDALVQSGFMDRMHNWTAMAKNHGVDSYQAFKKSSAAQVAAMTKFSQKNWQMIKGMGLDSAIGRNIGGVNLTEAGALAMTHLGGIGNFAKFVRSGGRNDFKDGNGTPISSYGRQFEKTDASSITGRHGIKPGDLHRQPVVHVTTNISNTSTGDGRIKTVTATKAPNSARVVNTGQNRRTAKAG